MSRQRAVCVIHLRPAVSIPHLITMRRINVGYKSCFILSAKPMTQELYQKIDAELQLYTCYFEQDGIENEVGHWCNSDDTWYSCRSDMLQLSRTFPDVYFQLYVEGEDHNDDWRAFFVNGKYQVNDAERVYAPIIPDEFIDGDASEEVQEYEDIIRAERQSACRTVLYHCLRVFLGRGEGEFPWNSELMDEAKTACEAFLTKKGFRVPSLDQLCSVGQAPAQTLGNEIVDIHSS